MENGNQNKAENHQGRKNKKRKYMNKAELQRQIGEDYNDMSFVYNGKPAGVTSTVTNYVPTFQVWYGENTKTYGTIDEVMNDKFYDGKSIADLSEIVEFIFA